MSNIDDDCVFDSDDCVVLPGTDELAGIPKGKSRVEPIPTTPLLDASIPAPPPLGFDFKESYVRSKERSVRIVADAKAPGFVMNQNTLSKMLANRKPVDLSVLEALNARKQVSTEPGFQLPVLRRTPQKT